ncbi:preprotein translocase subunit SecG [Mucilaginibacter sp. FT3.2]|uniref:preprotein translocase subunit SecG n=1 Tax=Mucilaginibacter sp. FT3.2 TaxID=2723090 RepID=UPI00160F58BA|nr:preprotein translocase subunit SecG [Mucilaginibacter sp. FT3.2]MBB6234465.1 preprotein translocase subunit SecG [Mucilaginibacter sp. FT3.2]
MYILIILTIIVCALLGLIVLIQNPKGGGLSSNFSSSSQLMGVQKTGDFLEKGTWALAIGIMVLALAINVVAKGGPATTGNSALREQVEHASKPSNVAPTQSLPLAPAPAATPAPAPKK